MTLIRTTTDVINCWQIHIHLFRIELAFSATLKVSQMCRSNPRSNVIWFCGNATTGTFFQWGWVGLFCLLSLIWLCVCGFCSILAEAKNLSFNATAAFKAYTNIKNYIDEADKVAKEAKKTSIDALQLVRKHTHTIMSVSCLHQWLVWKTPHERQQLIHIQLFFSLTVHFLFWSTKVSFFQHCNKEYSGK